MAGGGLSVSSRFTRSPHLFSPAMVSIELTFTNLGADDITDIKVGSKNLSPGMSMHDFAPVSILPIGATLPGTIGVDFNDSTHPLSFEIVLGDERNCRVILKPPVGELVRPVIMPEALFVTEQNKLRGMNEHSGGVTLPPTCGNQKQLCQRVFEAANVAAIPSTELDTLRFAGQTLSSKSLVLVTVKRPESAAQANISINCEKMFDSVESDGSLLKPEYFDLITPVRFYELCTSNLLMYSRVTAENISSPPDRLTSDDRKHLTS
uniref:AP-3 complex subunit beta C-terminal domain-containing protein n=1 Tax=Timema monikensis TaxID=170555 RepID=A0A7R9EAG0_9NEOP|nr:unnamed protein product [Timema monikensis]